MKLTDFEKAVKNYETAIAEGIRKPINPYLKISSSFCKILVDRMKEIELLYNDEGKVSTTDTLKNIEDPELRAAVYLSHDCARGKLLRVKVATMLPKYAACTPLLMLAHKEKDNVPYEAWDKDDELIRFALGKSLAVAVEDRTPVHLTLAEVQEHRELILQGKPATNWKTTSFEVSNDQQEIIFCKSSDLLGKMLLQTWLFNAEYRVPGVMILDPYNWDNVPEAYDEMSQGRADRLSAADPVEDLPW